MSWAKRCPSSADGLHALSALASICWKCGAPVESLTDEVSRGSQDTSQAAFDSLNGKPLGALQRRVLDYYRSRGAHGATTEEVELALELKHQTASARTNELWRGRLLRRTNDRRTNTSGRKAAVYVAGGDEVSDV